MHALDYCSQIVLNLIKIHPVHEDASHLQKYFLTPSAFLCSTPCCPFIPLGLRLLWHVWRIHPHWTISGCTTAEENANSVSLDAHESKLSHPSARCVHTSVPTHFSGERLSAAAHPQHLLPGAHPFNQYVKSSVVVTLNIKLWGKGLPFIPFHMFCLSKVIMVTLKYYQQRKYRCWYFSLQDKFSSVLITFIMLPKSVEFSQLRVCFRTCYNLTFNQGNSGTLGTSTGVEATGLLVWPQEARPIVYHSRNGFSGSLKVHLMQHSTLDRSKQQPCKEAGLNAQLATLPRISFTALRGTHGWRMPRDGKRFWA